MDRRRGNNVSPSPVQDWTHKLIHEFDVIMYSQGYNRYNTTQYLRDLYGDTPVRRNNQRAARRTPRSPRQNPLQLLERSLDNIARTLTLGYKHNDHINWVPPILPELEIPTTQSYGSNNTHYVIPKVEAVFAGRTVINKESTPWNKVEEIAQETWNLEQVEDAATRNIDFWRVWQDNNQTFRQGCEVKKTTGCFTHPPTFIRSSKVQLIALLDQNDPMPAQIHPSIYIIGSVDYNKDKRQWLITWWFIPVKDRGDFMLMNTSNFKWKRETTPTDDGWLTRRP